MVLWKSLKFKRVWLSFVGGYCRCRGGPAEGDSRGTREPYNQEGGHRLIHGCPWREVIFDSTKIEVQDRVRNTFLRPSYPSICTTDMNIYVTREIFNHKPFLGLVVIITIFST